MSSDSIRIDLSMEYEGNTCGGCFYIHHPNGKTPEAIQIEIHREGMRIIESFSKCLTESSQ